MPKPAPSFSTNRTFRLEKGLWLIEAKHAKNYSARAWHAGKLHYSSCDTSDYARAETSARTWFRRLKSTASTGGESMGTAAKSYIESIADAGKKEYHSTKWEAIKEFFAPGMGRLDVSVADVTSPKLVEFVEWRRQQNPDITASTLKKDLVTIRQILKHAVMRGIVQTLPLFPGTHIVGKVDANPRVWFEPHEWKQLQQVALKRIADAENVRTKRQREELLAFCQWMVHTCCRVDEARALRVRDVRIKTKTYEGLRYDEKGKRLPNQTEYCEVNITKSKTGPRVSTSRPAAVQVFRFLSEGKKANDLLFATHHRDAFRELLIAAGLRKSSFGTRNLKSLRSTGMMLWILAHPQINLKWLAANCGTSTGMIDQFYAAKLGVAMDGTQWL